MSECITRSNLILRSGVPGDVEAMALVSERATAQRLENATPKVLSGDSRYLADFNQRIHYDRYWSYLAFHEDRLAGFVAGYPGSWNRDKSAESDNKSDYLWLEMIDPDYQGKRIGSKLFEVANSASKNRGMERIYLYTHKDNERMQKLVRKAGYKQLGETALSAREGELTQYELELIIR